MKMISVKKNKNIINMLLLELGIVFLVLIIFVISKYNLTYIIPECLIKKNLHILCPSCGGTRCVINFVSGNFKASFIYHPVFFITIIYLLIVNIIFIINSFKKRKILTFLYPKEKFWIAFIIVIIIFTIARNLVLVL